MTVSRKFGHDDDDGDEPVSLGEVRLAHVTEDALKVTSLEDDAQFDGDLWVPKTQVHEDSEVFEGMDGNEGELVVNKWWADKKGFE